MSLPDFYGPIHPANFAPTSPSQREILTSQYQSTTPDLVPTTLLPRFIFSQHSEQLNPVYLLVGWSISPLEWSTTGRGLLLTTAVSSLRRASGTQSVLTKIDSFIHSISKYLKRAPMGQALKKVELGTQGAIRPGPVFQGLGMTATNRMGHSLW